MLVLPPLKSSNAEERDATDAGDLSIDTLLGDDDLLDSIDFSGIFEGFSFGADLLPELEISESHMDFLSESEGREQKMQEASRENLEHVTPAAPVTPESRRTTARSSHGKKKTKVDWTPELHRRFVTAVEELGVDKAVPSRILEIMGNHNLTRHNIASHLQKYRSQRKHSLAREAEAGSWSHHRKIYAAMAATAGSTNSNVGKDNRQWISPTIGFPPTQLQPQFRPLHVWGHPAVDQPPLVRAMWQGHTVALQPSSSPWPHPPNYIAYWQPHFHAGSGEVWGPNTIIPAPHFIPQPLRGHMQIQTRVAPPPSAGAPPQQLYSPQHWFPPLLNQHLSEQNSHPSKESLDDAIGAVLAKPWLPLPLGLKPPSTESVLGELQRQGVPKVPPACFPEAK